MAFDCIYCGDETVEDACVGNDLHCFDCEGECKECVAAYRFDRDEDRFTEIWKEGRTR